MSEDQDFYGEVLSFCVPGTPIPKGSMKAFVPRYGKRPIVTHDNKRTKPWSDLVRATARVQLKGVDVLFPVGAVEVGIDFFMPRPKNLAKAVTQHIKKPDIDKLIRAVLDSLTGLAWSDDSQVVCVTGYKFYAKPGEERAEILVQRPRVYVHFDWDALGKSMAPFVGTARKMANGFGL